MRSAARFPSRGACQSLAALLAIALVIIGCRKDEAAREVASTDVVGGRYVRFEDAARVRALSLAARDEPPSREDVLAYVDGTKGLDDLVDGWTAEDGFEERIGRVFNDQFGVPSSGFVIDEAHTLVQNASGVLESSDGTVRCAAGDAVRIAPWWQDGSATVSVCRALACGPDALRCAPKEAMTRIFAAVQRELADRARIAFVEGLGWKDLWAGEWLYGDRYLAFVYVYEDHPFEESQARPKATAAQQEAVVAAVRAVPLSAKARFSLPAFLPARAGVVTAPQFLKRHNNFRSRVRALSQALACEDVGPVLNPSGVRTMKNPDLTDFDRSHGTKPGCSSCHFGMDNLGSTLLGWDDSGHRQWWSAPSQKGHAFGVDGEGPRFLMETWVEKGPNFPACMAKQVWKSFSGGRAFSALPESTRASLSIAAGKGFRTLVRAVLTTPELTRVDAQ